LLHRSVPRVVHARSVGPAGEQAKTVGKAKGAEAVKGTKGFPSGGSRRNPTLDEAGIGKTLNAAFTTQNGWLCTGRECEN